MKTLMPNYSQLNPNHMSRYIARPAPRKKKNPLEFDFYLEEILNKDDSQEQAHDSDSDTFDEYPLHLPKNSRFWDNGYEDVEQGGRL